MFNAMHFSLFFIQLFALSFKCSFLIFSQGVRDYIHVVDLAVGHVSALKKLEENCGCKVRLSWIFKEEVNWKQNPQVSPVNVTKVCPRN